MSTMQLTHNKTFGILTVPPQPSGASREAASRRSSMRSPRHFARRLVPGAAHPQTQEALQLLMGCWEWLEQPDEAAMFRVLLPP
jgi:hypothetical protein